MIRRSVRNREENIRVNHERWLVSYSDFITLLFAFFVVMYSVSQVNESKYRALSETLNMAFANQKIDGSLDNDEGDTLVDIELLSSEIESTLKGFPISGQARIAANENWIELTLNSEMLFKSGSAEPSQEAKKVFSELATLLEPYDNEIQIVGHTDNIPIRNTVYANNWALSSARAVAIVDFLSFEGVSPDQMSAVAFGEFRPIGDNQTEEGRRQNRRVVVRISDQVAAAPQLPPQNALMGADSGLSDSEPVAISELESSVSDAPSRLGIESAADNQSGSTLTPVRLKGGDLLFTSDPDLPRLRELESELEDN